MLLYYYFHHNNLQSRSELKITTTYKTLVLVYNIIYYNILKIPQYHTLTIIFNTRTVRRDLSTVSRSNVIAITAGCVPPLYPVQFTNRYIEMQ